MASPRRKRREAKGWKYGDVQKFLEMSEEAMAFIEMKLALGR